MLRVISDMLKIPLRKPYLHKAFAGPDYRDVLRDTIIPLKDSSGAANPCPGHLGVYQKDARNYRKVLPLYAFPTGWSN